jgi:Kef-type K+ transport system membrane component KefB
MNIEHVLLVIAAVLVGAKIAGELAERFKQPAVLGEIIAGIVLGVSALRIVDPASAPIHLLSQIGVVVLLFAIGLETDIRKLLRVGGASAIVAVTGVLLPLALGYAVSVMFDLPRITAIVIGAAMTATSVGITARVLSDLCSLDTKEGQIILGAAVFDDVLGLVILAIVTRVASGDSLSFASGSLITLKAVGFLIGSVVVGSMIVPPVFRLLSKLGKPDSLAPLALAFAFGLAALAEACGSALIIGAFAAGLILGPTAQSKNIEDGVARLGGFFVPIFFVAVGAAVDLHAVASPRVVFLGLALAAVAFIGKYVAGFSPLWFKGRKSVIGVGMVPRGEVGLIFAQMGLAHGILTAGDFGAVMMMVVITTFVAPVMLARMIARPGGATEIAEGRAVSRLTNDA